MGREEGDRAARRTVPAGVAHQRRAWRRAAAPRGGALVTVVLVVTGQGPRSVDGGRSAHGGGRFSGFHDPRLRCL